MGTLVKDARDRSKFWYWCYTAADGRRLKKSTKETDRRKAKLAGQAIEDGEALLKSGTASEDQLRRIFNEMRTRLTGKPVYDPSVKQWFERWRESEKPAVSASTLARYKQISDDFLDSIGPAANLRLEMLTTDEVLKFRESLVGKGMAPMTINLSLKILKRAFKVALDEGILGRNPVATVRTIRDRDKLEKGTFTPEQVAKLVAHAKGDWKGLILAGFYTGGRLADLARLKWSNVDLGEEKTITFFQKKTEGRSSRPRVKIPIHPQLEEHLLAGPMSDKPNAPVFPELYNKPGSGKSGLSMAFRRIMEGAGIKSGIIRERQGTAGRSVSALSFHSLRHSFTSALANAGVTPEIRQKLTGHADLKSHAIYTHHELETIRSAIETLGRLPESASE